MKGRLFVLMAGTFLAAAHAEALWQELQNHLASLSSQGKTIVAESSHRIEEDRPEAVIATIQEIFEQAHR